MFKKVLFDKINFKRCPATTMQHLFHELGRTPNSVLPWICKVSFLNSNYVCVLKIKTHESILKKDVCIEIRKRRNLPLVMESKLKYKFSGNEEIVTVVSSKEILNISDFIRKA